MLHCLAHNLVLQAGSLIYDGFVSSSGSIMMFYVSVSSAISFSQFCTNPSEMILHSITISFTNAKNNKIYRMKKNLNFNHSNIIIKY